MTSTASKDTTVVGRYVASSVTLVLLCAITVLSQRGSGAPPSWHYPDSDMRGAERGKIGELKGKRRVYVSFFHWGTTRAYQQRVEQQVYHDLRRYKGLEIMKSPGEAEFAIHVKVSTLHSPVIAGNPALVTASGADAGRSTDIEFYVLTRGERRGVDIYNSRLIVKRRKTESEGGISVLMIEVGNLIEELKRLDGEK